MAFKKHTNDGDGRTVVKRKNTAFTIMQKEIISKKLNKSVSEHIPNILWA